MCQENDIDYMCQEKKKDSPVFKIAWTNQYNDSKNTWKKQRKPNYSDKEQHRQHKDQQNNNN